MEYVALIESSAHVTPTAAVVQVQIMLGSATARKLWGSPYILVTIAVHITAST